MPTAKPKGRTRRPVPLSPTLARLGDRVRAARTEAGLSQSQLGAPHFTRAYVSALELGKIRPSMKALEFLADRLGKPVSFFVEDEEQAKREQEREFTMLRAKELIARGASRDAVALLEPMLEGEHPPVEIARIRRLLGIAHSTAHEARQAVEHLTVSVEILAGLGREREFVRARRDLAAALLEAGAADRALAIYRQILDGLEVDSTSDPILRMAVLRGLGNAYAILGDAPAAIAYYEQALHWAKDVGDLASLGRIYSGLAYSYWLSKDYEAATTNMQRAISSHEHASDLGAVAELHNNLAVISIERRHFEKARSHIATANQMAGSIGRPALKVHVLNTEAELAIEEERYSDADSLCERSLSLASGNGYDRGRAGALRLLGRISVRTHQRRRAESLFVQAADVFVAAGLKMMAAECLHEVSKALTAWGEPARAAEHASRAYELSRSKASL